MTYVYSSLAGAEFPVFQLLAVRKSFILCCGIDSIAQTHYSGSGRSRPPCQGLSGSLAIGGEGAMRLCILLVLAIVLLLPGVVCTSGIREMSAEVPDEIKQNPPPGTYWSEELGVLVFDPPIPIHMPQGLLLYEEGDTMIYFDGGVIDYAVYQFSDYFVLTKFPQSLPECAEGIWNLTSVLIGPYDDGYGDPDSGRVTVYRYEPGDCIGDELGSEVFEPITYDPFIGLQWQQVNFYPPIAIYDPDFWVAWDYRPGTPDPYNGSMYTYGPYAPGLPYEDQMRFFEDTPPACAQNVGYGAWMIRVIGHCVVPGKIDIKPESCPNPINPDDLGLVSVAITGSADLDVTLIDPETVVLNGVEPIRWDIEDVSTPYPGMLCGCHTEGPDGFDDLVFKFLAMDVFRSLGEVEDNEDVQVDMLWRLSDGTVMGGSDCFLVRLKNNLEPEEGGGGFDSYVGSEGIEGEENGPQSAVKRRETESFALYPNSPNPFRERTSVSFSLGERSRAALTVHDASGRKVASLVDEELVAGVHTVNWHTTLPSGMYFCLLESKGLTAVHRMVIVR
jgi:hypothetical protein